MPDDCIFCKIASGAIPAKKVFESDDIIAFHDINPASPTHVLIMPKTHYATLNDIPPDRMEIISKVFDAARQVAKKMGIADDGYRVILNTNRAAGQEVFHIHFHVMGGRPMGSMG